MKIMKRIISSLLILVMLAAMAPAVFAADSDVAYEVGENILTDGGFELAEQMWGLTGIFSVDQSTVKSGYRSMKISCNGKKLGTNSSPAMATTPEVYRLSFWIKTQDLTPMEAITVGLMQNGWPEAKISFDGTTDWQYVEIFTPKKVSNTLNMYVETKEGSSGTAWIDDASICPMHEIVYDAEKAETAGVVNVFSDIADSEYIEEIETLYALGLMNGTAAQTFSPNEGTKRGDFATVVLRLMGIEASDESNAFGKKSYPDVSAESSYYIPVMAVTDMGFMNGNADGTFKPDAKITVNEAIKVFVSLLGKNAYAESSGGYPMGYYTVAKSAGLIEGLENANVNEAISREQLAMLIYNLLEADGYTETGFTPDQVIMNGFVPFAENYLDIEIKKGIVTANEYTSLTSQNGTDTGKVIIDGKRFSANGTNAGEHLGYKVKYYAKKSKNGLDDTLLYVKPATDFNETVTITAEQIGSTQLTSDRKFTISYIDQNDKAKTIKLGLDTDVIFNGVYNPSPTARDFAPKIGSVTLIDNGNDNIYDVVLIKSAIAYRVSSISAGRGIIADKNGKPELDVREDTLGFAPIITKDGKNITLADIKQDDLLFVYQSKHPGNVLTQIEIYNNKKTGTITKITGNEEIIISSYRCELSDILFLNTAVDKYGNIYYIDTKNDSLKLGDNGTVWLDKDGKVIDFDFEAFKGVRYGYVVDRAYVDEVFSATAKLRLVDEDGNFYDYDAAENLYLDGQKIPGEKVVDSSVTINLLDGTTCTNPIVRSDGKVREQLIKYKVNASGKISSIDTVKVGANEDEEETLECESTVANRHFFSASNTISTSSSVYVPQNTTKVFVIPSGGYNAQRLMDYSVSGSNYFKNEFEYSIEVYDADEFGRTNALVVIDTSTGEENSYDAPLMLVTNIGTAFNDNGDECKMFEGMSGGTVVQLLADDSFLTATSDSVADVQVGDIIRYVKGSNGMLNLMIRAKNSSGSVFNMAGTVYGRNHTLYYSNNLMLYGKVLAKDGVYVIVDVSEAGGESLPMLYVCSNTSAPVYMYKPSDSNNASVGTIDDISVGDKVFLHFCNTRLVNAVVVEAED